MYNIRLDKMPKIRLDRAWMPPLISLDVRYPKKVTIYVDKFIRAHVPQNEIRIIVLWEPDGFFISDVMRYPDFYTYVFTYHSFILDNNPKAHFFLGSDVFVDPQATHKKVFNVSSVIGYKRDMMKPGYNMRHELWFRRGEITIPTDFYLSGSHYGEDTIPTDFGVIDATKEKRLGKKKDVVFDSMFHIAIEPVHMDNCFSEKIIDCFMTKTVPIYIGAYKIGNFFNADGIISVKNIDEAILVCNGLTEKDYHSRTAAIEDNHQRAQKYINYNEMLIKRVLEVLP